MNRRAFLSACALAACHPPKPIPPRRRRDDDDGSSPPSRGGGPELTGYVRRGPWGTRPVHARGDQLVLRTAEHLEIWDLRAMKRVNRLDVRYCDATLLVDGGIAALFTREGAGTSVDLIDARGNVTTLGIRSSCGEETRIVGGRRALYVAARDDVAVYELSADAAIERPTIKLAQHEGIAALYDGRFIAWSSDRFYLGGPGARQIEIRAPDDGVLDVVPLPDGTVWLSLESTRVERGPGPERLALASAEAPLTPRVTIPVAPLGVWDFAATPSGVAALLHRLDGVNAARELVLFGADGRERWRTSVDNDDMTAFVALGDARVVLVRDDRTFEAWDVATGARVPVA